MATSHAAPRRASAEATGLQGSEVSVVRPALERPNVTLLRNARALKLETNGAGGGRLIHTVRGIGYRFSA